MRRLVAALAAAAVLAVSAPAMAVVTVTPTLTPNEGSTTDVFNGATAFAFSALLNGFSADAAFGVQRLAPDYNPETTTIGTRVVFAGAPIAFINFDIGAVNAISNITVYASSDGVGTAFRGFSGIRLYSSVDSLSYTLLDGVTYLPELGPVAVSFDFATPVVSRFFRFEGDDLNGGARLLEIDATAVPEPATWAMMIGGVGLLGGALRRRRARGLAIA